MEIPLKSPGDHLGLGRAYDRSVMFHFSCWKTMQKWKVKDDLISQRLVHDGSC